MNYLVHLYLAGADPQHRLGSLMGDFVKGPLPTTWSPAILAGIRQHRSVDSFAHRNPHCRSSRLRIAPRFGHVRSIMVDIFYDHLLASHWSEFHDQPLADYAADIYALLAEQSAILPPGLARIAPRMTEHNWLVSYAQHEAVERALRGLASRLSRPTLLAEGGSELQCHQTEFLQDFYRFMAEVEPFARNQLQAR